MTGRLNTKIICWFDVFFVGRCVKTQSGSFSSGIIIRTLCLKFALSWTGFYYIATARNSSSIAIITARKVILDHLLYEA